ncbi:MAG: SIMPL domain-containing protein [Cypionkella sp.]
MRILTALALSAATLLPMAAWADTAGTLTVTGSATVSVVPDLATITLGVTTTGDTAASAMSANNDAVSAVIARLIAAQVADRDMQTSSLTINPNWVNNADGSGQAIKGYVASNMLTVRIKALETTGAVLDAAITDGANTLNGLSFGLQDQRPVEDEARKEAVTDALARAKVLAVAAGTKLGPILSISEGGGTQFPPMEMFKTARASAVPVAAGEVGISASVTIVWQLGQ